MKKFKHFLKESETQYLKFDDLTPEAIKTIQIITTSPVQISKTNDGEIAIVTTRKTNLNLNMEQIKKLSSGRVFKYMFTSYEGIGIVLTKEALK